LGEEGVIEPDSSQILIPEKDLKSPQTAAAAMIATTVVAIAFA
jgi:hypothetical protein